MVESSYWQQVYDLQIASNKIEGHLNWREDCRVSALRRPS